MMDRVYEEGIPTAREALQQLNEEFSGLGSRTDWNKLRIEPLLELAISLERLLRSAEFPRETSRLRSGVVMFHSDLVYLRDNVRALKVILKSEGKSGPGKLRASAGRRGRQAAKHNRH